MWYLPLIEDKYMEFFTGEFSVEDELYKEYKKVAIDISIANIIADMTKEKALEVCGTWEEKRMFFEQYLDRCGWRKVDFSNILRKSKENYYNKKFENMSAEEISVWIVYAFADNFGDYLFKSATVGKMMKVLKEKTDEIKNDSLY